MMMDIFWLWPNGYFSEHCCCMVCRVGETAWCVSPLLLSLRDIKYHEMDFSFSPLNLYAAVHQASWRDGNVCGDQARTHCLSFGLK